MTPLPNDLESVLRPYQVQPARQLYRALTHGAEEWGYPGAVDLSDVGTGKTYQDLAAAIATGRSVGVLCPPAGRAGWMEAFTRFDVQPAFVESWEAVRGGWRPEIAVRSLIHGFRWQHPNLVLICDEAQTCRNPESLTTFAMEGILKPRIPAICASATLAIAPYELYIAGAITGLHDGTNDGWTAFCRAHGCVWNDKAGRWQFTDGDGDLFPSHLAALNAKLIPLRGCRVRKADCGEQAATSIKLLPIETPEAEDIRAAWSNGMDIIQRLKYQNTSPVIVKQRERILRMGIMQDCEQSLVAPVSKLIKADFEQDKSVVAFFTFTRPREAMARALNRWEGIHGKATKQQRERWVADFQADRIHYLGNNIGSGGSSVSLHDLHGRRPRVAYIFPTTNPVHAGQAPGRVHRSGGVSDSEQWLPCIPGTLSMWTMGRTAAKLANLGKLNDG